jgi:predicted glycoside hydrolase/deacetylase ChbG (UPF0249 family)
MRVRVAFGDGAMSAAGAAPDPAPPAPAARWLVVNADDFGLTRGVNAGIIAAHEHGIVTSASLMVRYPAAAEAANYAAARGKLSLGLHLDLGEWQCAGGDWQEVYCVVPLDDAGAVAAEARRQLGLFRELAGRDPTHLDSHQHVHRGEPVRSAALALAAELGVPLRDFAPRISYCGGFYGQAARGEPWPEGISRAALLGLLHDLPPGVTELSCHPGLDDELTTMYCRERRLEVEVLCDAEVASAVRRLDIRLVSYAEAAAVASGPAAATG